MTLLYGTALAEGRGVAKEGSRLTAVLLEDGASFEANVFIDATYEGDLLFESGVSSTIGRESYRQYCEKLAGVQAGPRKDGGFEINPYDAAGNLLPEISAMPRGTPGYGDCKVQAYNFRLCATNDKGNMRPFPRPADYDPFRYELALRYLLAFPGATFENAATAPSALPDNKFDINGGYFFSTDYVGGSWQYPSASRAQRNQIWLDHFNYQAGYLYFVANDPRVPSQIRDEANTFGLAADEFVTTANWPHQLYVREARRMIGSYVLTETDMTTNPIKPDSIGMGSYPFDSHSCQRILLSSDGKLSGEIEGEFYPSSLTGTQLFQIPYRALLPQPSEISNLLVPVCYSASHVAWCAIRLEPQFMIMGEAAGAAAAIANSDRVDPPHVDFNSLAASLAEANAVLSMPAIDEQAPVVCPKGAFLNFQILEDRLIGVFIRRWFKAEKAGKQSRSRPLKTRSRCWRSEYLRWRLAPNCPKSGNWLELINQERPRQKRL